MPLTVSELAKFERLNRLDLHSFTDLSTVEVNPDIQSLCLSHWYKLSSLDLQPLTNLKDLRFLSFSTDLNWDGTNRHLLVDTFEPLTALSRLEVVEILGVVPKRDGIDPIGRICSLQKVSIGNTNHYQLEDFARLSSMNPGLKGVAPISQMNFTTKCGKCKKKNELFLQGAKPRAKKYACPDCNLTLIKRHLKRWNNAKGVPRYANLDALDADEIYEEFRNKGLPC